MDVITMQAVNKVLRRMDAEYGGMYDIQIATEGQDTFEAPKKFSLDNDHTLKVYVDGALALENKDYVKLSDRKIQFTTPCNLDEIVLLTTDVVGTPKYSNPPYDDTLVKADIKNIKTEALSSVNNIKEIKQNLTNIQTKINNVITVLDKNDDGTIIDNLAEFKTQWDKADEDIKNLIVDKADLTITNELEDSLDKTNLDITNIQNSLNETIENLNNVKNTIPLPYNDTEIKNNINLLISKVAKVETQIAKLEENQSTNIFKDTETEYEYTLTISNGSLKPVLTDNSKVSKAYNELSLGNTTKVVDNLNLPNTLEGCNITWKSENEMMLTNGGVITRPSYTQGNIIVKLAATIELNNIIKTKEFEIIILKLEMTDKEKIDKVYNELTFGDLLHVTDNLILPTSIDECSITWKSNNEKYLTNTGIITRSTDENKNIILTATMKLNDIQRDKIFNVTVLKRELTDKEKINKAYTKLIIDNIDNVTENITLPKVIDECNIIWKSNDEEFLTNEGVITRPIGENKIVSLIATISLNEDSKDKEFIITIVKRELTDKEKVNKVYNELSLDDTSNITEDIVLPKIINDCNIAWSSDNQKVITNNGVITRSTEQNGTATLTATIKLNEEQKTKEFIVTVLKRELTDKEKIDKAYNNLTIDNIDHITENIVLPSTINECNVVWKSDNEEIVSNEGVINRPTEQNETVKLIATITLNTEEKIKEFILTVLKQNA